MTDDQDLNKPFPPLTNEELANLLRNNDFEFAKIFFLVASEKLSSRDMARLYVEASRRFFDQISSAD